MSRFLLIVTMLLLLIPSPASAQTGPNCLYEGRWLLSYAIVFEYGSADLPGAFARWVEYGAIGVEAVCAEGGATFSGDGNGNIEVVNNFGPLCSGDFEAIIAGKITDSGANYPIFNVEFAPLTYINGDCGSGGTRTLALVTSEIIDVGVFEGNLITGFVLAEEIPQDQVTREVYIVEAERRYRPEVLEVQPEYTRYFLRDVPLTDRFTFTMDWDGAPEPAVDLSLQGGEWVSMSVSGDEASYLVSIQSIPLTDDNFATTNIVPVTMDIRFPFTQRLPISLSPDQIRMAIVAVPSWASASDFYHITQNGHVVYHTEKYIPSQPIQTPTVTVPDLVPTIGGTWGLEPVQMIVNVGINSLGTTHSEDITGVGALHFAGETYEVKFDGDLWTTITGNGVEILNSPFTISLEEPVVIKDSIPLISFVPALGGISSLPVVGDILETFFSPVSLELQVTADVTGSGIIGVTPAGELGITEGTLKLSVNGTVGGVAAIPIAWFGLLGTIGADVVINLVPEASITECNMQIGVIVAAGAEGQGTGYESLLTQIPLCE